MKHLFRVAVAIALGLGLLGSAWAQASRFVGTWMADVQNSKRPRALVVSQESGGTLRARWGFQDQGTKLGLATTTIDEAGVMTLTTNSDSVVVLKVVDDTTLRGTFTPKDGKQMNVTATRSTPEALAAFNAPTAAAAAAVVAGRTFLAKPDVDALATGKTWRFKRPSTGDDVRWDLREGGALFGNNYSTNQKDAGTWTVNEQGQLCIKWRGGSNDGCWALMRDGDKLKMVFAMTPDAPLSELAVE